MRPATLSPSQFSRFVDQSWGLTEAQEKKLQEYYDRDKPLTDKMKEEVELLEAKKVERVWSEGAQTYSIEILHQLMGVPTEDVQSYAMQWGVENEPFAIELYEMLNFVEVERNVRIHHPKYAFVSGETDGRVGKKGLVEVKSPISVNHLKNLLYGDQLEKYNDQIQGYLWIFDCEWCDFISYDPRFENVKHQISVHRVYRDEQRISLIEERCVQFWKELVLPKLALIEEITGVKAA